MDNPMFYILLFLSYFFFRIGWYMLCVTLGYRKLNREMQKIDGNNIELLYALGNPFNSYEGGARQ